MRVICLFILFITVVGCGKETENLQLDAAPDYLPLASGKYRTYRTDSTVSINFGNNIEVRSYQEKHVIDAPVFENNLNGYRILVYIRDLNGSTPWKASGSYFVAVPGNVEVVENNLRFIKLANPVKTGQQWKGNSYLPEDPYESLFDFNNDNDMAAWDYEYTATGETISINGKTFSDVATVKAVDESLNFPVTTLQQYGFKNLLVEQYAKGVGLIYQEFVLLEYQPQNADRPGYRGFGVKRTLIDHN